MGDRATILKLSLTYPLPENLIRNFIAEHPTVYVIEEGEPFLEEQIKNIGCQVIGKELFPAFGELSSELIRTKLLKEPASPVAFTAPQDIPARPPVLCPSCPHRSVFFALTKIGAIITTDIGCYTIGVFPPVNAGETCLCMGASIGNAMGIAKMRPEAKVVATIGDSTFLHSGITGLMDVVYNRGIITVVILDNRTTAMTGHQQNPSTGYTINNEPTTSISLESMVRACGVNKLWTVDAYNLAELQQVLEEATSCGEPAVVITRKPCALLKNKKQVKKLFTINYESCRTCKACLQLGCPSIELKSDRVEINPTSCNGCGVCAQLCKFGAISEVNGR